MRLFDALIGAARDTRDVVVRSNCGVTCVQLDESRNKYLVNCADATNREFEAVLIAVSTCGDRINMLKIICGNGSDASDMLRQKHNEDEVKVTNGRADDTETASALKDTCSHTTVGAAKSKKNKKKGALQRKVSFKLIFHIYFNYKI